MQSVKVFVSVGPVLEESPNKSITISDIFTVIFLREIELGTCTKSIDVFHHDVRMADNDDETNGVTQMNTGNPNLICNR